MLSISVTAQGYYWHVMLSVATLAPRASAVSISTMAKETLRSQSLY